MITTTNCKYRCVNCGEASPALYKKYGPTVLKLTKCDSCKGIVDKYVEYDPVIVMIDLVLMSKEAQRHILYNTDFKAFWKLFIILMMLETYAVWRSDSLFSIAVNTICDVKSNYTINSTNLNIPIHFSVPEILKKNCAGWLRDDRGDDSDLFIWEKDFYVQFISTFSGIVIFISTVHLLMRMVQSCAVINDVPARRLLRACSLAGGGGLCALPALLWAADCGPRSATPRHLLVSLYGLLVFHNVLTVLYESPTMITIPVLLASNIVKYLTTFHMTPFLRGFVT